MRKMAKYMALMLLFTLLFANCGAYAEENQKTILFENELFQIVYTGNCYIEDPQETVPHESFEMDMFSYGFSVSEETFDYFPALHLEVILENKSDLDLQVSLEGGIANGWNIDPNYASFGYSNVKMHSKLKTTLDLYNTDFLYEITKPDGLETLQLDLVLYEDRKSSLLVISHVSSETATLSHKADDIV